MQFDVAYNLNSYRHPRAYGDLFHSSSAWIKRVSL